MDEAEGVIKFQLDHDSEGLVPLQEEHWQALQQCRDAAYALRVLGQDDDLYEGYGFGNVSVRLSHVGDDVTGEYVGTFVISGTQTGALPQLSHADYAYVRDYDLSQNWLRSVGVCKPSSEAMTHAALYDVLPQANAIIHGHHAGLWQQAERMGLCCTAADVPYGTPQMATAMQALISAGTGTVPVNTIVMLGHLDGFITWGTCVDEVVNGVRDLLHHLPNVTVGQT